MTKKVIDTVFLLLHETIKNWAINEIIQMKGTSIKWVSRSPRTGASEVILTVENSLYFLLIYHCGFFGKWLESMHFMCIFSLLCFLCHFCILCHLSIFSLSFFDEIVRRNVFLSMIQEIRKLLWVMSLYIKVCYMNLGLEAL